MGHVVRMTLTGATGITFVFLVDAANLFWLSQLGERQIVAAIGFAFAIQFFSVSSGIGLMIAATALVSRAIGAGDQAEARHRATATALIAMATQALVATAVVLYRHPLLALAGAAGETEALAARYLVMTVPSLVPMVLGMVASGTLRAEGDGRRAMYVTLTSGSVAMLADPLLILWLGLDGAAFGLILSRLVLMIQALRFTTVTHDLMAKPAVWAVRAALRPYMRIAMPAIATQLSAPFGNYLLTGVIAGFGDNAVAAWALVARLSVLAFGGIFALAGAIGGIFGQNYGARRFDRLVSTYRDALVFCGVYTLVIWALLAAATPWIGAGFALDAAGFGVLSAFTYVGAGAFAFSGALFVANAAFNSLDRPLWATAANWLRDGVLMLPVAIALSLRFGAEGVIYAQALVGALVGVAVAFWGWRFTRGLTG
jgi:Na+-driven multidrug efflux pump